MMGFLVSPTDGPLARILEARTSLVTERYGADVLASSPKGLIGWQRKTLPDLLARISDGRLADLLPKIQSLPFPVLVLEGELQFTGDGHLMQAYSSWWTRRQIRNLLRSLWYEYGVQVELTDSIQDTAEAIRELAEWMQKGVHKSLFVRPKAKNEGGSVPAYMGQTLPPGPAGYRS